MTKILAGAMVAAVVALFLFMLTRLSSDALGMAVGVVFGVLAGVPSALLVLASSRRQEDDDDLKEWGNVDGFREWQRQQQGERALPPYPYQPPVIVLAAPVEQPPVVNYTDACSVTIHKPVNAVPTIADRQRQIAAQRGGRVFRVVGEREEWDA